ATTSPPGRSSGCWSWRPYCRGRSGRSERAPVIFPRSEAGAQCAAPLFVFSRIVMAFLLLALGGALGGFLVGLVGVGGGVVYVPVLLLYFTSLGIEDPVLAPLTVGSSLLCVGLASASGAYTQWRAGAVHVRVAVVTGLIAGLTLTAASLLVTTQPWYDRDVFQVVFGLILLGVAVRMVRPRAEAGDDDALPPRRTGLGLLAVSGASAGALAAAAGVGGGIVLVPLYHGPLRLPTKEATATSTASIVVIAAIGIVTYALLGQGVAV